MLFLLFDESSDNFRSLFFFEVPHVLLQLRLYEVTRQAIVHLSECGTRLQVVPVELENDGTLLLLIDLLKLGPELFIWNNHLYYQNERNSNYITAIGHPIMCVH